MSERISSKISFDYSIGNEGFFSYKKEKKYENKSSNELNKALSLFNESVQIQGNKTRYDVPSDYVYAGVKQYKKKKLTLDSLLMILDQVTPIIDANITKYTAPGLSVKDSLYQPLINSNSLNVDKKFRRSDAYRPLDQSFMLISLVSGNPWKESNPKSLDGCNKLRNSIIDLPDCTPNS